MQTFRETLHIAVEKTIKTHDQSDSAQPVLSGARWGVRKIKSEVSQLSLPDRFDFDPDDPGDGADPW